ncbi:MAG: hypothetical protein KGJ02_06340 [Verrucomicrobiota bacterium]|nr:hypothetical protein [Verrucomicrobiota bacterium]
MKILVLVIASDNEPRYIELQKLWQLYMHYDPEHVESYFIRADPQLRSTVQVKGDVVWSRTKECGLPGILMKTLLSLEHFLPRLKEFDFVIRTNLSSFYAFPRLLEFLETLPRKKCYAGPPARQDGTVASGCGIIFSSDVVELLVKYKHRCLGLREMDYDDVVMWHVLSELRIDHIRTSYSLMRNIDDWNAFISNALPGVFHVRTVASPDASLLYSRLVNLFYPEIGFSLAGDSSGLRKPGPKGPGFRRPDESAGFHTVLPEIDLFVGGKYDFTCSKQRFHLGI